MESDLNQGTDQLIQSFRTRAHKLRRNAMITIGIIVGVLAAGIAIFISAGTLATKESGQIITKEKRDRLTYLAQRVDELKREMDYRRAQLEEMEKRLTHELTGQGGSRIPGDGPIATIRQKEIQYLQSQIDSLFEELKKVQQQKLDLENEITRDEASNDQPLFDRNQVWILISAIATRLGSIILLLFLVKILVPLYRYNTKLAFYYDARADALVLMEIHTNEGKDGSALERITAIFSPDDIDFTSPPESPAEQAIELAKHILSADKSK
jgi:hypothetical protein